MTLGNPDSPGLSRRGFIGRGGFVLGAAGAVSATGILTACSSEKEESGPEAEFGSGEGPQEGRKVIFVVHDKNPFFTPVQRGFEDFGALMGWETQFTGPPRFDVAATVDLQANAIGANPDGVIFTRVDTSAFDENINRVKEQGIKIVLSNVASDGYQDLGVGFVGQSFIPAGRVCGEQIAKYALERTGRQDGLIILGNFSPGNSAIEERIEGTRQGIEASNQANGTSYTSDVLVTSSDEAEAVGSIDARYTRDRENIVGWAMAAFDHQFVATWSRSNNLEGEFAVGGFDLVQPVLDGVKEGLIDFTLGQNPYAQGWIASALLAMELDPGYPARDYDTGAEVVDASNIDAVIEREKRFS